MAQYTIVTTREQEVGLNYSHSHFAAEGQDKAQYLQQQVSHKVLDPMFNDYRQSNIVAFDKSIATIPDANEAKAAQEIQAVIVANGGTIIVAGPPPNPIPPPITRDVSGQSNTDRGAVPDDRGVIRREGDDGQSLPEPPEAS